ncbi:MAG TPA: glycosyltransferase family 4 protein [Candidatus Saccharimonadales bacterium]|nr:glycosyltransferase family 4 protein [Candidatus Saccharimonadales bacterium]
MKILITTFTYPPNRDGVAEHSTVLANGLARRGHAVTVATEFHPDRKLDALDANPRVEQFKISGLANWRIGIRGETVAYQKFLHNYKGDLILFSCWDVWSTSLALPQANSLKTRKVLVSHGFANHIWNRHHQFPWGLGQWIGGWPLVLKLPFDMRKLDQLVTLSHRCDFDRFFDNWVARATGYRKRSIIPNGAFAEEFIGDLPDFRAEFGIGSGSLLLNVANYCDRKNQIMLLRAFRQAQLDGATLVLIGSEFNDYAIRLKQLDAELQRTYPAGHVLLLEKLTRVQTCAAFRSADLFVLSAKAETQPIALLESMASHTPFLSTDVGCVEELPGGIVVHSEQEMIEKMKLLVANPTLRKQLADEGWAASQKTYNWSRVIDAYENLFRQLLVSQIP